MLLKSKQDAEEFVFWCVTLQCEVLPKGIGALQNDHWGHCCLGTGIACTVSEEGIPKRWNSPTQMDGGLPTSNITPKWLQRVDMDVYDKVGRRLVGMNDFDRKSHKEIGTLLLELYKDELNYWFR